jgi:hypothetical protein
MNYVPNTQQQLIREIKALSNYSVADLKKIYNKKLAGYKGTDKYYARKRAIAQLQAIYFTLKKLRKRMPLAKRRWRGS